VDVKFFLGDGQVPSLYFFLIEISCYVAQTRSLADLARLKPDLKSGGKS